MSWPTASNYSAAVQDPQGCFRDADLRKGQAAVGPIGGLPLVYSGNFAAVYQIVCPSGDTWAVKCFTRRVPDLQHRYEAISRHLVGQRLPFMVEFLYLEEGIRIGQDWFPVVKMRWIEGLTLNAFVQEYADKPALLERLAEMWLSLAEELRQANLAHGDLQNGNVLLAPGRKDGSLALRLIDYDGMWAPALANSPPGEVGHPDFQHPQRQQVGGYSDDIDNFSHLVISTALRCLIKGGSSLWKKHDNGENLLFRKKDFMNPGASRLFSELLALPDEQAQALAGRLLLACRAPLSQSPNLSEFSAKGFGHRVLTAEEQARIGAVLGQGNSTPLVKTVVEPALELTPPSPSRRSRELLLRSNDLPPDRPVFPAPPRSQLPPPPISARTRPVPPEEDDLIGLSGGWLKWVLPALGLMLAITIGLAVYQIRPAGNSLLPDTRVGTVDIRLPPNNHHPREEAKGKPIDTDKEKGKGSPREPEKEKSKVARVDPPAEKKDPEAGKLPGTPSTKRVPAGEYSGSFAKDLPSVLLSKQADGEVWQRVAPGAVVSTSDTLTALPGYNALIRTSKGAMLHLHGHVRDFSLYEFQENLAESRVILHQNDKFDLDLTLLRGRVYIRHIKDKGLIKVRLRFSSAVWDLNLTGRGAEVGVDLVKQYTSGINYRNGEEPRGQLVLCLFTGAMELKPDPFTSWNLEIERPKVKVVFWDSAIAKISEPRQLDSTPPIWDKRPPAGAVLPEVRRASVKIMITALKNLEVLSGKKSPSVALKEAMRGEIPSRLLAIYCLGAIDDAGSLIDVLGDENTDHWVDRLAAVYTLRLWLARGASQGKALYDDKARRGILLDKKYKIAEARTVYDLLHNLEPADWGKAETFEFLALTLQHKKTAIAELGFFHLVRLGSGARLPQGFNAAAPIEDRERFAMRIHVMITKKLLPPPKPPTKPEDKKDG